MRRRVRRSAQHHAALISLGLAMIAFQPGGAAGAQTPSIVQNSATSADDAATLQTQALLLYRQGKYTDAEPLFRRALETRRAVLGEQHRDTATSYNNLAVNLNAQGRYADAEPLYLRALETVGAVLGEQRPSTAAIYANLAFNLDAQGRYADAEPLYRRALETFRVVLGEQHPDTATSYNNVAFNLNAQGRYADAEPLYRRALETRRVVLGEQYPYTATSYNNLAGNLSAQGRYADALPFSRQAVVIVRGGRARAGAQTATTAEGALARAKINEGSRDPLDYVFRILLDIDWGRSRQAPGETPALRGEAFNAAQDLSVSTVGQAMAQTAARTAAGGGARGKLARRQQDLSAELQRLDRQDTAALGRGDAADAKRLRAELDTKSAELAVVNADLVRDFPQYADLISPKPLSLTQAQARLAAGEGLLLIVPAGKAIYSFAVSRTGVAWSRVADGAATTQARVARLRCQIDAAACAAEESPAVSCMPARRAPAAPQSGPAFDRTAAYCLYHDLIAPVEAALGGVTRLYVTTSGPLSSLPLSLLLTEPPRDGEDDADAAILAGGRWFSDRYALTTLPAVSGLRNLARDAPAGSGHGSTFLGYGAPTLEGKAAGERGDVGAVVLVSSETGFPLAEPRSLRLGLAPLPGTEVELRAIALVLKAPAASVRLGDAATERAVRADPRLSNAAVVAFATHGLLPTSQFMLLLEPGLVFTPPATASDADDGFLAASEVSRMTFNADWIILSACNTASADGTPGADNLSSLARAFLYAGAQALLASHWRISDEITATLTVETLTIRRDHPELTRAQALQQAMRSVRTGAREDGTRLDGWNENWTHPTAWAPFSVIANQDR